MLGQQVERWYFGDAHRVSYIIPFYAAFQTELLCMTVFMAVWKTGSAAADDGGRATVQSIEVTAEQVTIHLSSASVYTQAVLPKDPLNRRGDRCYVDVSGVLGQQVERWYFGDAHRVERVRVAQFQPQTVRVVLDLLTAQPCRVASYEPGSTAGYRWSFDAADPYDQRPPQAG